MLVEVTIITSAYCIRFTQITACGILQCRWFIVCTIICLAFCLLDFYQDPNTIGSAFSLVVLTAFTISIKKNHYQLLWSLRIIYRTHS